MKPKQYYDNKNIMKTKHYYDNKYIMIITLL